MQSFSQIYLAIPEKTPSILNWIHLSRSGLNVVHQVFHTSLPTFRSGEKEITIIQNQWYKADIFDNFPDQF